MKSAALSDLPMHSGRVLVVTLHPVHSEVWLAGRRAFSIDQRQRYEMAAVFRPKLKQRKSVQIDFILNRSEYGSIRHLFGSEFQSRQTQISVPPEFADLRRQQDLDHFNGTPHKLLRPAAEGEFDPLFCAEEVR